MMHTNSKSSWTLPLGLVLGLVAAGACAKSDKAADQRADSAARNLTLAPTESTAAMRDVPAPAAQPTPTPPPSRPAAPKPKPPVTRPTPTAPAAAATRTAAAGSFLDLAVSDTLSSRTTKVGDGFTASVVTAVKPAPNPSTPGTLQLSLTSVSVGGTDYPLDAKIDSLETVRAGRGVTGGDVAKVGAGAAAGAILGRVLGKNAKGAIIGGVVGGAVGAGVATQTKDADIVLPKGAHINASLVSAVTVKVS